MSAFSVFLKHTGMEDASCEACSEKQMQVYFRFWNKRIDRFS